MDKKTHYSIYKNYQVNKANIVGHSMGGVSGFTLFRNLWARRIVT